MGRIAGIIWGLLIIVASSAIASDTLVIREGFEREVLGSELGVFKEKGNELKLQEALSKTFITASGYRPNLGFNGGAVWIKTTIKNLSDGESFRFHIHQPLLDSLNVFVLNEDQNVIHTDLYGEALDFDHRKYNTPYFIEDLTIPKGAVRNIILRVVSEEQIVLPVYVATEESSRDLSRISNLLFGAYFGLIAAMALYNLFIYFTVRDQSYLLYVVYILSVGSTQAVLEGFFHQYLWPDNAWLAARSVYLFTALVSITSILFLSDFLKTAKHAPRLYKLARFIYVYFGLIFVAALIDVNPVVHMCSQIGIALLSIYILSTAIVVYRSDYPPAKFFIIAWVVLIIGIIVYALKDAGLVPSNPVTNYMMQAGSAIEAILLSIALADRINILKRERSESQEQALLASMENARIVSEQNVILEEKVKERTSDLENTNSKLNVAISELKETQSQLVQAEKMASLGQLTAGVAHEINNPINFVSANIAPLRFDVKDILDVLEMYDSITDSESFSEKKKSIEKFKAEIDINYSKQEVNQLLEGIEEGAKRTAEIVKGLKNFSRIDESSVKECNLNEGIRSTLSILKNSISRNVKMSLNLDEELPEVECMGGKINQVFLNIINNGLQAMEANPADKPAILTITTTHKDEQVSVIIEDTGPGMDDEIKSRIFEPFFTTKEVGKGTGLGLSIVFKIIETHDGKIDVVTESGKGTKFILTLPVKAHIKSELEL